MTRRLGRVHQCVSKGRAPCAWTTQGLCNVGCGDLRSWRWIVAFLLLSAVRPLCVRARAWEVARCFFSGTQRNLIEASGQDSRVGWSRTVPFAFFCSLSSSCSLPGAVPFVSYSGVLNASADLRESDAHDWHLPYHYAKFEG